LRLALEGHAAVIDLHLLAGLDVVVYDHAATAGDQRLPDLDRGEPVRVDVSDQAPREEEREVRDVLGRAGDVAHSDGRHGHRFPREDVIDDREVVDSQVPQNVHVWLEQAEIRTDGVVVVDVAQGMAGDQLFDLPDGGGVNVRVIDHQHQLAPL